LTRQRTNQHRITNATEPWHLGCKLSYRDHAEIMAARGASVAPSTILRWVQHYAPEFEKRWNRFARLGLAAARGA
jgi:transposase-like protein